MSSTWAVVTTAWIITSAGKQQKSNPEGRAKGGTTGASGLVVDVEHSIGWC